MKKKPKKTVKTKFLTKRGFAYVSINEIERIAKEVSPYQAFILIGVLDGFCKNELGIILFKDPRINKALANMRTFYAPNTCWVVGKESAKIKHLKNYKGRLVLDITKTIKTIKSKINSKSFTNDKFLAV
jgi:hypothetical protein